MSSQLSRSKPAHKLHFPSVNPRVATNPVNDVKTHLAGTRTLQGREFPPSFFFCIILLSFTFNSSVRSVRGGWEQIIFSHNSTLPTDSFAPLLFRTKKKVGLNGGWRGTLQILKDRRYESVIPGRPTWMNCVSLFTPLTPEEGCSIDCLHYFREREPKKMHQFCFHQIKRS